MSPYDRDRDRVIDLLDTLLSSKDRLVCREIDAACCRTKSDWDRLHEAQDEHETAKETAIQEILQMIVHARRGR